MFTLIMNIESKEGKVDEIMKVMKENVSEVLKRFPACKVYEVYLDQETEVGSGEDLYSDLSFPKPRKNIITIIEKWDSIEDYDNYVMSDFAKSMESSKTDFFEKSSWSLRGLKQII